MVWQSRYALWRADLVDVTAGERLFGHDRHRSGLFGDGEIAGLIDRTGADQRLVVLSDGDLAGATAAAANDAPGVPTEGGTALVHGVRLREAAVAIRDIGMADLRYEAAIEEMRRHLSAVRGEHVRFGGVSLIMLPGNAEVVLSPQDDGLAVWQVRGAAHVVSSDIGCADAAARHFDLVAGAGIMASWACRLRLSAHADGSVLLVVHLKSRRLAQARRLARAEAGVARVRARIGKAAAWRRRSKAELQRGRRDQADQGSAHGMMIVFPGGARDDGRGASGGANAAGALPARNVRLG